MKQTGSDEPDRSLGGWNDALDMAGIIIITADSITRIGTEKTIPDRQ